MNLCKVTGLHPCKCKHRDNKLIVDFDDYRVALRRAFTDHAVYTSCLITESVPILQPDAAFVSERLLRNPTDIRNLLQPLIGSEKGEVVERVIGDHLKLAAATLEPVRNNDSQRTARAVEAFLNQGNEFGSALSSLNPSKLPLDVAVTMVRDHNNFVVNLATLRQQKNYEDYINTYDVYFSHMMEFSDALCNALI